MSPRRSAGSLAASWSDGPTDQADHRRNIVTTAVGQAHLRQLDTLLADIQDELLAPPSLGER